MTVQKIKAAVRKRDNCCCVDCGWRPKNPNDRNPDVHRKEPGSKYTIDGCVTVCRKCHAKRHLESGIGVSTVRVSDKPTAKISIYCHPDLKLIASQAAYRARLPLSEFIARIVADKLDRPELGEVPRKSMGRPRLDLNGVK